MLNAAMALPPPTDADVDDDSNDDGDDDDDVDGDVDVDDHANVDSVTDTQPNAGATRVTGRWTQEEDAKLTSAIADYKKKYYIDWVAVAALVLGRMRNQCKRSWQTSLEHGTDQTAGREGKWTKDEDDKLRESVQVHGGKDWDAITTLVPGRTKRQCAGRWHDTLRHSIDRTDGRTGRWIEDEDAKLKDAVGTHGGKDWVATTASVPGRTKNQCKRRWHNFLDPNIKLTAGRTDPWTSGEDSKLEGAVQKHGGKNWIAIAALAPGRTKMQCSNRWHYSLKHSIDYVQ